MSPIIQQLQLPIDYYKNIIDNNHKSYKFIDSKNLNIIKETTNNLQLISDSRNFEIIEPLSLLKYTDSNNSDNRTTSTELYKIMSSTEFIKPHPKQQLRYNNSNNNNNQNHNNSGSSSSNNNNNSNSNNNISSNTINHLNLNNNNFNSASNNEDNNTNRIPLYLRNSKFTNYNNNNNNSSTNISCSNSTSGIGNCQNNLITSSSSSSASLSSLALRGKQHSLASEILEQTGPVNLVTNNSNNSCNNKNRINNSNCNNNSAVNRNITGDSNHIKNSSSLSSHHHQQQQQQQQKVENTSIQSPSSSSSSPSSLLLSSSSSSSSNETEIMAGIYAQKLSFTVPNIATNNTAAAAVANAYQFNYPHIYGRDTIYGTTALYSSHYPLSNRNQLHNRSNYIGIQPEQPPYSYYVSSPVTYNGGVIGGRIGSPSISVPAAVGTTVGISRSLLSPPSPPSSSSSPSPLPTMRSGINHHSAVNFLNTNNDISPLSLRIVTDNKQQQNHHHHNNHHPLNLTDADNKHQSKILSVPVISSNNKEQIKNFTITYPHENSNFSSVAASVTTTTTTTTTTTGLGKEGSFKIPSGKEGSLKHRILIRPQQQNYEKEVKKSSITTSIVRSSSNNNSTCSNFSKGAFIELANGVLRKVEDMRTEDFIQSAEKSQHHQLVNSTVVKIVSTSNNVTITFSYDKNRSKASVEVPQEHPFFVYGQGWASCNPELSLQIFGLNCQRLQVGDICISLTSQDDDSSCSTSNSTSFLNNGNSLSSSLSSYFKEEELVPQNLSNKSSSRLPSSPVVNFSTTNPTTAIGETMVTSRLITPPSVAHHLSTVLPTLSSLSSLHPYENHLHSYEINHSPSSIPKHHHILSHHSPPLSLTTSSNYHQHFLRQQQQQQRYQHDHQQQHHQQEYQRCVLKNNKLNDDSRMSPPSSISAPSSRPPSNQTPSYSLVIDNDNKNSIGNNANKCSPIMMMTIKNENKSMNNDNNGNGLNMYSTSNGENKNLIILEQQTTNFSDTLSRKRRWSAPDNICDDDYHQKSNKILIHS